MSIRSRAPHSTTHRLVTIAIILGCALAISMVAVIALSSGPIAFDMIAVLALSTVIVGAAIGLLIPPLRR